jgi:hypothetical protein
MSEFIFSMYALFAIFAVTRFLNPATCTAPKTGPHPEKDIQARETFVFFVRFVVTPICSSPRPRFIDSTSRHRFLTRELVCALESKAPEPC